MRCASARRSVSDSLDGPLRPDRAADLARHLEGCPACRGFARELGAIVRGAGKLSAPEPPARVWLRIAAGVRAARTGEDTLPAPAAPAVRWRYALAAAAVLLLVGGAVFVGLQSRRPAVSSGLPERGTAAFTMAKLREAQVYYEKAIDALSQAVGSRGGGLEPALADVFERNLSGLDRTIQVCRLMVDRDPDDPALRAHLLAAYREKVSLFEDIMAVGRDRGGKIGTTTL